LSKVNESFINATTYYSTASDRHLNNPELYFGKILHHFNVVSKVSDGFKKLGEEDIIHFKKIIIFEKIKYDLIKPDVDKVRDYSDKNKYETEIEKNFEKTKDTKTFKRELIELDEKFKEKIERDNLVIQFLQNHYYSPSILTEDERINYINHIINVPSEVRFIRELDEYLKKENNFFKKFDWWMFSKIDQTLDKVFIPYYNSAENKFSQFFPDFIFWMRKGEEYLILFIDPKGIEHTDAFRKIDGFRKIFEDEKSKSVKYKLDKLEITVRLFIFPKDISSVPEKYSDYCFDNLKQFENVILL